MLERVYQAELIERLGKLFPDSFILKNDSAYLQGVPDLLILVGTKWAMLEVKPRSTAPEQPNQRWYVEMLNDMCYSAFIFPENEREVIGDLQRLFASER